MDPNAEDRVAVWVWVFHCSVVLPVVCCWVTYSMTDSVVAVLVTLVVAFKSSRPFLLLPSPDFLSHMFSSHLDSCLWL